MNWLLLRGLSREQRHWGTFPSVLEARVPGARAYCLDFPGAGTEHARPSPASVEGIVRDLRERWLPLKGANEGAWGLLGVSLGGMVTMSWAADFPGDFERIVLMNTSAGNVSPPWHRMNLSVAPRVIRAMLDSNGVRRERSVLSMTTNLATANDARARDWARFGDERPMTRATVLKQVYAGMRFKAPATIRAQVLVLSSAKDTFTSPECPRRLADRFQAPLRVHPEANHDLGTDAPDWIADRLREWLEAAKAA